MYKLTKRQKNYDRSGFTGIGTIPALFAKPLLYHQEKNN